MTDRVVLTPEQAEALFESACARSFQYGEVACISLLDLELILQKGVSKCETHARWESMTAEERAERCKHLLPYTQDKNVHAKAGQTRRARDYSGIKAANRKPCICIDDGREFISIREASQYYGIPRTTGGLRFALLPKPKYKKKVPLWQRRRKSNAKGPNRAAVPPQNGGREDGQDG